MLMFDRTAAFMAVFKVERLYGEPSVCLFSAAPTLGDMRVVFPHDSGFVHLKLGVKSF